MFVDDEANILKSLRRLFDDEPFEVETAASGEDALVFLRAKVEVGVIVTDQRMPGMSGAQFLEKAREIVPEAVRIVLTGYADVVAAVDAINKGGAHRYITKPWNDQDLVLAVREAAQRYSLVRENRRLTGVVLRQNKELKEWNVNLEQRVAGQTGEIRRQNETLCALNEKLQRNFADMLGAFAALIELRGSASRDHSRNVAALAERIACSMALPAEEIETIRVAALLHDIGKIGCSDLLLRKVEKSMTPAEKAAYMEHPVRGQTAIDTIEELRPAGVIIRGHHECWDGSGFPDNLHGEAIPVGSRIVAVADFLDHEIASRRNGSTPDSVLDALRALLGTRFDPRLFRCAAETVPPVFAELPQAAGAVEMELSLEDLCEGMVLSRDIVSGTGILLLRAGMTLDSSSIKGLRRNLGLDPGSGGVFVVMSGEKV